MIRCPGQDKRFWKPEDISETNCPHCQAMIEFWKDEPKVKCPNCKQVVANPKLDLGCAEWCQYAEECLGLTEARNEKIMCDRLVENMKHFFGDDSARIDHALAVLRYAGQIQLAEGGDPLIVKAAAILHDIGIGVSESKHGSTAQHETEGAPIARDILTKREISSEQIEQICRIVGSHHRSDAIDSKEFQIVWDADMLVNLPEWISDMTKEKLERIIAEKFKTARGHQLAVEMFVSKK